jgi:hypothetical protein
VSRRRVRRLVLAAAGVALTVAALTAGVLAAVAGGPSAYRATTAHLGWPAPKTRTVAGRTYHLVEAPTGYRELVDAKASTAQYAVAAWCRPVLAGTYASAQRLAAILPAGDPLVAALDAERIYAATPASAAGADESLVILPAPSAGATHRWCTWIGAYPRVVAATGGHLDPPASLGRPAYPAYYGQVVSEVVPVEIEYGWRSAGGGVHAWAAGALSFARVGAGGRLAPFAWTLTDWWSSPKPVPGPRYLPVGFHWNFAGAPTGAGVSVPAGAVAAR